MDFQNSSWNLSFLCQVWWSQLHRFLRYREEKQTQTNGDKIYPRDRRHSVGRKPPPQCLSRRKAGALTLTSQNLTHWFLVRIRPVLQISRKFIHNVFWVILLTKKQTNGDKNNSVGGNQLKLVLHSSTDKSETERHSERTAWNLMTTVVRILLIRENEIN